MYSTSIRSIGIVLIMTVVSFSCLLDFQSQSDGNPARDGEELLSLRSDSGFYPGEMRREEYGDVTGDGIKDAVITSRLYPPGRYYLHVIDLSNGDVIYNYTATYGNLNFKLLNVDADPALEIIIDDYDHHIQHTRLFVYDVQTSSIVFEPPMIDGRYQTDILEGEFMLKVIDDPASYTPDRTEWWEMYDMSTWTKVWDTPKFSRGSGIYEDTDNDGIHEYIYWSSWMDYTPYRGNVYIIDLAHHQIQLNTSDVGAVGYGGSDLTRVRSFDLDNDGFSEILIHAFWEHNSTSRTYLYSGKTNSRIWSTVNLSKYRLRENPILEDMDGDGISEIMLILSAPGTEYDSKLVVLDPQTGEVLLEDEIDHRLYQSQIHTIDLNDDGSKDLFVFNATDYHMGAMTFRAYDPEDSWNEIYKINIPMMLSYGIFTNDDTGELVVNIVENGMAGQIELRTYDPSDMGLKYSFGGFPIGNLGSQYLNYHYYNGLEDIVSIQTNYRDSSGGNYSRIYICNLSNGMVEYTSPMFSSEDYSSVQVNTNHLNNDGITDFILFGYWSDPINPTDSGRMLFLDGATFNVMWDSGEILGLNSPQVNNYSISALPGFQLFSFDHSDGVTTRYNRTLLNISGDLPAVTFSVDAEIRRSFKSIDLQMDDGFELEMAWAENGTVLFEYYDLSSGEPVLEDTNEIPGSYGYTDSVHRTEDGGTLFEVWTSDSYRIFEYPEMNEIHFHNWTDYPSRMKVDMDQDDSMEYFWAISEDLGTTGISDLFIIDMATGEIGWELPDVNYSAGIYIDDLEEDGYFELIVYKELYWDTPEMWGISVYNITTDLKPELLAPLETMHLVEDGDPGTLSLTPLFWNDGPMTFDAVDLSGDLDVSVEAGSNVLTVTPLPNAFGIKEVDIIVSDETWDTHFILKVNISPTPDAPILLDISGIPPVNNSLELEAEQDVNNTYQINAYDPDMDELHYLWTDHERFNVSDEGLISFMPMVEDGPRRIFDMNISDGGPGPFLEVHLIFDIARKPHPPTDVTISMPENGTASYGKWDFIASALNVDEPWGDVLSFDWSSNIDGYLGNGSEFTYTGMSPGNHTIRLNVSDTDGFWITDSIMIEVLPSTTFQNPWNINETTDLSLEIEEFAVETEVTVNGSEIIVKDRYYFKGNSDSDLTFMDIYLRSTAAGNPGITLIQTTKLASIEYESKLNISIYNGNWEIEYNGEQTISPSVSVEDFILNLKNRTHWFAIIGWTSSGLFDSIEVFSDSNVTVINSTDGPIQDDDDSDDDTDDDSSDHSEDDELGFGSFFAVCAVFLALIVLVAIIALVLVLRSASKKGENPDWEE